MKENLSESLKLMFGHEGGYVNRKTDAGGPTKFGVTLDTLRSWRRNPALDAFDVKMLTLDEATKIMHKQYWKLAGCDELPSGLDYAVFDFAVNSGPARAVKMLQKQLGIPADGLVGAQTLAAVERDSAYEDLVELIHDYCYDRLAWLKTLKGPTGWASNGRGWERRITGIDPLGKIKQEPGVIGHAVALAGKTDQDRAIEHIEAIQPRLPQVDPVPPEPSFPETDTGAKAVPQDGNPWAKWESLGSLLPAILAPLAGLSSDNPIVWAAAAVMVVVAIAVAYRLVYRIRHQEA